ncbi:hypothetical protein AMTRI_Chr08g207310 [Amborella trichopoda]|uniref:DEUBAD domain-containing protein n=1 Tax=Amborella trichopoda TaxID=13333 RepID=W1NK99_AMBTC|nr:uncharacterized protein LOC18423569 [Amborella trichopoda]XP_020529580.1 uncharacterized protein LOC18423569 [Amborella trichopoda]XP_020529586.1 uncharacterized protein LOC18423569 [Amborella trichopoda]XP_020529589.1 uncharacterized protein LOC18423569 [Amborella trichopoda]XP_020529594.1 uncharacterized protein LOC18423569 [Amborella trichopoda]XP_020529596.1 uncharacterized protein LOC18423569 [Amborella trichopoda]XP_020529598.1 uncharacterized protein LOC18423569 [Amborella trichopod|eukprot:XP_006828233.3 uncharacterized protein LOC18423569 [Amborella trichopoda]
MGIVKLACGVSRVTGELSSMASLSSEDEDSRTRNSASDEENNIDSGGESDALDSFELGETGSEFCQLGNQSFAIPLSLYELPDLSSILSVDTWNNCLTEEERYNLSQYLPDMDQETFMRTLKELFCGANFHFGSPLTEFFNRLKGGLCEPRVALYRQGLNLFQKKKHYHMLKRYQDSMVGSLLQIREAWEKCGGYSIQERLRLLKILRSQKGLMSEREEDSKMHAYESESDTSSEEESSDGLVSSAWKRRANDKKHRSTGFPAKTGHRSLITMRPSVDVSYRGEVSKEPEKHGKVNPKGILKIAPKVSARNTESSSFNSLGNHGVEKKTRPQVSLLSLPQQDRTVGFDPTIGSRRTRSQFRLDEATEHSNEMTSQKVRIAPKPSSLLKSNVLKVGKRSEASKNHYTEVVRQEGSPFNGGRLGEEDSESGIDLQLSSKNGKMHSNLKPKKASEMLGPEGFVVNPNSLRSSYDYYDRDGGKKGKASDKFKSVLENHVAPMTERAQPVKGIHVNWPSSRQSYRSNISLDDHEEAQEGGFSTKLNEWGLRKTKKWKMGEEMVHDFLETSKPTGGFDSYFHSDRRAKHSWEKSGRRHMEDGESPSNSSESFEEDAEVRPSTKRLSHGGGLVEDNVSYSLKKKSKSKIGSRYMKRPIESDYLRDHGSRSFQDNDRFGPTKFGDDYPKQSNKLGRKAQLEGYYGEKPNMPFRKPFSEETKRKGKTDFKYTNGPSVSDFLNDDVGVDSDEDDRTHMGKSMRKSYQKDEQGSSRMGLLECNSSKRKQKAKEESNYLSRPDESTNYLDDQPLPNDTYLVKKQGKIKAEVGTGYLGSDSNRPVRGAADEEPEAKLVKKPSALITPSVHSGFSFSIIHLLSAVRRAMLTQVTLFVQKHSERGEGRQRTKKEEQQGFNGGENSMPSLSFQEIVSRVSTNPGDPAILKTQEPLQDLVRGVLKLLSSKSAPLGAKSWKPLVLYEKPTKGWSWSGPVSSDNGLVNEETSPEAWGVSHKMLSKLVDAYANWLKNGQDTLQQIGSLAAPPSLLMLPNLDEKERFRDLRAQKSLTTISPSSDEVRDYFRREELIRYSVPDRAFAYTAADGRKSVVAPLRRCGGKPTSKARDHFMLKPDRPPHVTILCLVRDAAARLPGSIGTRADVCTLIRDSQYIVENVSDAQINQVVSGALDRLHYERDPCVQFDGDRKLWVYLHREREEEDFEDDGTSSTKKWKRQKKDGTEPSDMGNVNDVGYQGIGDQVAGGSSMGYDFSTDFNVESSSIYSDGKELGYADLRTSMDDGIEPFIDSVPGGLHQGHPMGWEVLRVNPIRRDTTMQCHDSSANDDVDDDAFDRDRPGGF